MNGEGVSEWTSVNWWYFLCYISHIMSCRDEIKSCMAKTSLHWNDWNSEVIIITPPGHSTSSINNLSSSLGALLTNVYKEACIPGAI